MAKGISLWQLCADDLPSFVSEHLRQKDNFLEELHSALRDVVSHIREHASYSISRVMVSGDLVGGITALNADADFQLTLYLSDFRSTADYHKRYRNILSHTRDVLEANDVMCAKILKRRDSRADGVVLVRIMVGANKETMYRQFMQDKDKSPYQATLSELRQLLIQSLPSPVKDVILLVKYWRKCCLRLHADKPTARFYELLVIRCWEMAGRQLPINLVVAMKSVLTALSDWKNISITWEDSQCLVYPRQIADGKQRDILARSGDYDGPIALDPIDPRIEYCAGIKTLIWDEISRSAREALMEPLFQGLSDCTTWKER